MLKTIFLLSMLVSSVSEAAASKVVVGYFTKQPSASFEATKGLFEEFSKGCASCEIRNLTPYEKGEYDPSRLQESIKALPEDVSFVFFDWNERSGAGNKDIAEALNKKAADGLVVIAAAGIPPQHESSCPLEHTLMGQVDKALIIGELTERERLLPQCYFGPEMLTAVTPPKAYLGQGHGPLIFVAKLASNWHRRSARDWPAYLKARKGKNKKLWTELGDFFP